MLKNLKFYRRKKGLCQGSIVSSQLVNTYGEHMIWEIPRHWIGDIFIGERRISNQKCTDDTILIVLDEKEMAELVALVEIASEKLGLRIYTSKTKVMLMDWTKCIIAYNPELIQKSQL